MLPSWEPNSSAPFIWQISKPRKHNPRIVLFSSACYCVCLCLTVYVWLSVSVEENLSPGSQTVQKDGPKGDKIFIQIKQHYLDQFQSLTLSSCLQFSGVTIGYLSQILGELPWRRPIQPWWPHGLTKATAEVLPELFTTCCSWQPSLQRIWWRRRAIVFPRHRKRKACLASLRVLMFRTCHCFIYNGSFLSSVS